MGDNADTTDPECPSWYRVPDLDRETALSGAYAHGFADGYAKFAEALEEARSERDQLRGAVEERDEARANADEAWKWVEKACAALGVKTVFEIPDTSNQ